MTAPIKITDQSFEQDVLQSTKPVLVDFWASWCPPCRAIAPILEDLARDKAAMLTVAKIDVDQNKAMAGRYGVRGIPALMLFKDGKLVATQTGARPKEQIYAWVDSALRI